MQKLADEVLHSIFQNDCLLLDICIGLCPSQAVYQAKHSEDPNRWDGISMEFLRTSVWSHWQQKPTVRYRPHLKGGKSHVKVN